MSPKAVAKELTVDLAIERETKNKVRFNEVGDDDVVGSLYLRKKAMEELGNPEDIEVIIRTKV
jgi:hypothetical protein